MIRWYSFLVFVYYDQIDCPGNVSEGDVQYMWYLPFLHLQLLLIL